MMMIRADDKGKESDFVYGIQLVKIVSAFQVKVMFHLDDIRQVQQHFFRFDETVR
jgi:hypothetical protein